MKSKWGIELVNREVKNRKKNRIVIDPDALGLIARFRENVLGIDRRFKIYKVLNEQNLQDDAEDILRFQIVYLMSSLDFFMHELYSYGIVKIFKKQSGKSERYREYRVPLKLVEVALFDGENIQRYLKETITEINSTFTFMHPNRIREMLNIIGYEDAFESVEEHLKEMDIIKKNQSLAYLLETIYERRNKISHQTDIDHGKEDKNLIKADEVIHSRDIIVNFVEGIYHFVCQE